MAEAVMVKLEELGVGAWLAQGDRVIRFDFCHFVSFPIVNAYIVLACTSRVSLWLNLLSCA